MVQLIEVSLRDVKEAVGQGEVLWTEKSWDSKSFREAATRKNIPLTSRAENTLC